MFLARAAALSAGAHEIEPTHLLAGVLDVWPQAVSLRHTIRRDLGLPPSREDGLTGGDIPFSANVKRLLTTAMVRADQFGHYRIRPEHLLVALAEETGLDRVLRDAGIVRNALIESATQAAQIDDSAMPDQS